MKVGKSITFNITAKATTHVNEKIKNTACVDAPEVPNPNPNTPDGCDDATVEVAKPKQIDVCVIEQKIVKTIDEKDFDKKARRNKQIYSRTTCGLRQILYAQEQEVYQS